MTYSKSRLLGPLTLCVLIFCFWTVCGFEELVPTHSEPIGMVRDPLNGCIYVIFRRQIRLVCDNGTVPEVTVVMSERQLEGDPISGWLRRLDASGHLIFFKELARTSPSNCVMFATSASRQQRLSSGQPFRVSPELAIKCQEIGENSMTKNAVHLSAVDNQTLYFMAVNKSNTAQSGLYSVKIANLSSSTDQVNMVQQLPVTITPSFAFVGPDYLAFRTSLSLEQTQLHYIQMTTNTFTNVTANATTYGLLAATALIGPFAACPALEFHWIYAEYSSSTAVVVGMNLGGLTVYEVSPSPISTISVNQVVVDAAYNRDCQLVAVLWDDSATKATVFTDFIYYGATSMTGQAYSPNDVSIVGDELDEPLAVVARDRSLQHHQYVGTTRQLVDSRGPNAVAAAGSFLFSYERVSGSFGLFAYPLQTLNASAYFPLTDPSTAAACPQSVGISYRIAVLAINSTFFAVALQRPQGTVLEYHSIIGNSNFVTNPVGLPILLFPSAVGAIPPVSTIGSSVVQAVNETHVLLSLVSTSAPGTPAIAALPSSGIALSPIIQDGSFSASDCPTIAIPKSLVLDPTGSRGVILFSGGGDLKYFAEYRPENNSMTGFLSDGAIQLQLSTEFSRIDPGTIPGVVNETSESIVASSNSAYFGFTFTSSISNAAKTTQLTLTANTAYAVARGASRTLALTYSSGRFCTVDFLRAGAIAISPVNLYNVSALVSILALDSGNFSAFEVGSLSYMVYSDAGGWRRGITTYPVRAALAWPGQDQFVLVLQIDLKRFILAPYDSSRNSLQTLASFNCTGCSNFVVSPVSSSAKLLFMFQDTNEGLVVNSIEFLTNQFFLRGVIVMPSSYLLGVAFFDRDTYLLILDTRMLIVRLGNVLELRQISSDLMLSKFNLGKPWPVRLKTGAYKVALTVSEQIVGLTHPRTILLDPTFCRATTECLPMDECDGFVCVPSNVTLVEPLSRPPIRPTCPLPVPFGAVCVDGVYVVSSNTTSGGSVIITTPVVINGSLTLTNTSTITIQNNASITVSGCITVGGDLVVKLPFESGQASGNITVIEFGGGYCDGGRGTFNSTKVVPEGAPDCAKVQSTVGYGERSISLLYQYDISSCTPSDAIASGLTIGGIVGIVVAAVVLVAVILATVLYVRFRQKVMPYDARRKEQADAHELE
eukprot:TRINITY_DN1835_c0_g2_i1.p1 TRINITY_DN1835_c0_g2~~TRINITY_DN1835_c0_g2_i1.p1  ORF type:complete len:1166 (+),score=114.85 TRINITY_DN1835_c0_g2_i1:734-4231(+)